MLRRLLRCVHALQGARAGGGRAACCRPRVPPRPLAAACATGAASRRTRPQPAAAHPHPRSVPQHALRLRVHVPAPASVPVCSADLPTDGVRVHGQRPRRSDSTSVPMRPLVLLCCCSSIAAALAPRSVCRARACARLRTTPRSRWRRVEAAGICVVRAGREVHAPPQAAMLEGVSMKARRRRRATGGAIFPREHRADAAACRCALSSIRRFHARPCGPSLLARWQRSDVEHRVSPSCPTLRPAPLLTAA